jgi:hypothetical protein
MCGMALREMCTRMGKVNLWMSSRDHRVCRSSHSSSKLGKVLLQYGLSVLFSLSKSNI